MPSDNDVRRKKAQHIKDCGLSRVGHQYVPDDRREYFIRRVKFLARTLRQNKTVEQYCEDKMNG